MRVLALGDVSQRKTYFQEGTEYVNETPYEVALLASVLQTLPRTKVPEALETIYKDLPDGGRLVVTVPSLEWACTEFATKNDPGLGAYMSIYGTEGEPFLTGFTLLWLRRCMEEVGFAVVEARTETFKMQFTMGELKTEEMAKQHVAIGVKRQVDPRLALDWMQQAEMEPELAGAK